MRRFRKLFVPQLYNPAGSTFFTFGDGADQALASSLYLNLSAQARRIPVPVIGDDFSRTKGNHTLVLGANFMDILAHDTTVADYNTTEIWTGRILFLGLCGSTPCACGGGKSQFAPGGYRSDQAYDFGTEAFSFMLARIANVQSDYNYNAQGQVLKQ